MKCTCDCFQAQSTLTLAGLSFQCQMGSLKSKTVAKVVVSSNLPSHSGEFESTFAYFFSILSDCSNNARATSRGIRHEVLALARKSACKVVLMGLTRATVNRILLRHAVIRTLVPGKSTGAPPKTAPRQDYFVQDGATGLLHKCSGLDGVDEEFVGNGFWPQTINNTGSYPVVSMPIDPQESPCWLPSTAIPAWIGQRGGRTRQWPIGSMSSSVTSPNSKFTW